MPRRSRCKRPRSGSAASKHIPLRILAPLYKVGVLSLEGGHHFGAAILQHRNIKRPMSISGPSAPAHPREIRTPRNLRCKLPLQQLIFLSYTKTTKYEALEKNAVSESKMLQLGNLQYSRCSRKAPPYWEIFGLFIDGEIGWPV